MNKEIVIEFYNEDKISCIETNWINMNKMTHKYSKFLVYFGNGFEEDSNNVYAVFITSSNGENIYYAVKI